MTMPRSTQSLAGVAAFAALTLVPVAAFADIEYISPGATWTYANTDAAHVISPVTGFEQPSFDDSLWYTGNAPFGNVVGGDFGYNTYWEPDYDPQVRKTFFLSAPQSLLAEIGVDNGYDLYVNGALVSSANAEGYTYRWEYTFNIPASYFVAGVNTVALQLEDHGGLTAFDMRLSGPDVPEPGVIAFGLLAAGSVLGLIARKKRQ